MGLIQKASFIRICKCGKHGEIVLTDGTTREFYSQEVARYELDELLERKLITEPEFKFLKEQIPNLSDVPEKASLESVILDLSEMLKLLKDHGGIEEDEVSNPKPTYVM